MKKKWVWILILLLVAIGGCVAYRIKHRDLFMHFAYQPCLLSDEQVAYMKSHPDEDPVLLPAKDLYMKKVNIAVRIRNEGEVYTGGPIYCRIEGTEKWNEIEVEEIAPKNSKNGISCRQYFVPMGIQSFSQSVKPIYVELNTLKMWRANYSGAGEKYTNRDHKPFFPRDVSQEELFQVLNQMKEAAKK